MKKSLLALTVILFLVGCSAAKTKPKRTVFIALETNNEEEKMLSQTILHEYSRRVRSHPETVIDFFADSDVLNIFSGKVSNEALKEAMSKLRLIPSNDKALVEAVKRAVLVGQEKGKTHAVIVTSGTRNTDTIREITEVTRTIHPETTILVIGLDPKNRLPMSKGFSHARGNVKFAALESEWLELVDDL
jgi:hypothetical protein